MFEVYVRRPVEATEAERETMVRLVVEGGAVSEANARDGVPRAEALVFCKTGGRIVGVAALKVPVIGYREGFTNKNKASFEVEETRYPLELGYVSVDQLYQRQGIGPFLSTQVVLLAKARGLFATTGEESMLKKTLPNLAFRPAGKSWQGKKGQLTLLLREPTR